MAKDVDRELRKELLFHALEKVSDLDEAFDAVIRMEQFILEAFVRSMHKRPFSRKIAQEPTRLNHRQHGKRSNTVHLEVADPAHADVGARAMTLGYVSFAIRDTLSKRLPKSWSARRLVSMVE